MHHHDFECRFASDDAGAIEAVAVRFNTVDSYRTTFDPEAFGQIEGRIPMLWSHDPSQVIGSWTSFRATKTELRAVGSLNLAIARAVEVRAMLTAGDISGVSIGFETVSDSMRPGGVRHITKARLRELSLVAFASVPGARVTSARSDSAAASEMIIALNSAAKHLRG
ncbi:prohead peptidase. Unknown type peptidase. MEROPS family U35 [Rhizobium sp. RU35A]|uniref:HK97 family phage prohead protease n=1 Tax=Rhizobium sp. RU35A TaxID=1907414 RepID=UPI00095631A1|nr:HK97 family phage prohead protease [Rhizobium sp. RU35A]SIQ98877.1 prohead peptidase. Unknown type peptidase. MEROPS family U35 [Rhizobium sp. RU35A]